MCFVNYLTYIKQIETFWLFLFVFSSAPFRVLVHAENWDGGYQIYLFFIVTEMNVHSGLCRVTHGIISVR